MTILILFEFFKLEFLKFEFNFFLYLNSYFVL